MKTTWIRRLYDAGSRLEIRADRWIEHVLWGRLRKRFGKRGRRFRRRRK